VIAALRPFGDAASERLAEWGRAHPSHRATVAEALGQVSSAAGLQALCEWVVDADPAVRTACLQAASEIGLDDRFYYYALRALGDSHPEARAMAARALGRSGRAESSDHLARLLADEWSVAAQSASALKRLGEAGRRHLAVAAAAGGTGAELARRTLWEAQG
jgi:HEAT repeat protein